MKKLLCDLCGKEIDERTKYFWVHGKRLWHYGLVNSGSTKDLIDIEMDVCETCGNWLYQKYKDARKERLQNVKIHEDNN